MSARLREVRRVLIIDDDERVTGGALENGCSVYVEHDARRTRRRLEEISPDFVVVDLHLNDDIDGCELANEIKAQEPTRPVALVSAGLNLYPPLWHWLRKSCVADFIEPKSMAISALVREVETGEVAEPPRNDIPDLLELKRDRAAPALARHRCVRDAARALGVDRSTFLRLFSRRNTH